MSQSWVNTSGGNSCMTVLGSCSITTVIGRFKSSGFRPGEDLGILSAITPSLLSADNLSLGSRNAGFGSGVDLGILLAFTLSLLAVDMLGSMHVWKLEYSISASNTVVMPPSQQGPRLPREWLLRALRVLFKGLSRTKL